MANYDDLKRSGALAGYLRSGEQLKGDAFLIARRKILGLTQRALAVQILKGERPMPTKAAIDVLTRQIQEFEKGYIDPRRDWLNMYARALGLVFSATYTLDSDALGRRRYDALERNFARQRERAAS